MYKIYEIVYDSERLCYFTFFPFFFFFFLLKGKPTHTDMEHGIKYKKFNKQTNTRHKQNNILESDSASIRMRNSLRYVHGNGLKETAMAKEESLFGCIGCIVCETRVHICQTELWSKRNVPYQRYHSKAAQAEHVRKRVKASKTVIELR